MGLRKGADKGAEAAKRQTGPRSLVRYLTAEVTLKDEGDMATVRPITEYTDWVYVDVHRFVPTKAAPADHEGNWPKAMSAVCQNDEAFIDEATGQYMEGYGDCYICKAPQYQETNRYGQKLNKKSLRGFGLMALRELVTHGNKKGVQDVTVEVKINDETKKVRNLVVAEAAQTNFWANLNAFSSAYNNTVRDRDYIIRVTGEGTDKSYTFIPLDKIPDHVPGSESWKNYEQAIEDQGLDLEKIVLDKATPEFYQRFFIPSDGEEAAETETSVNSPAVPDESARKAMEERIRAFQAKKPAKDAA